MSKVSKLPFFKRGESNEITIQPLSVQVFRGLPFVNDDDLSASQYFDQRKAMILAATNITADEFDTFTAPDFNTLAEDIQAYILTPSDELKGKPLDNSDFVFTLLFPFENDLSETIETINFDVPKVAHSQALAAIDDNFEREDFMFRVVCGIDKTDINQMKLNDYLSIKPKVGDFFLQSGDYFRPTTLKA
ncbi:phage tail assembly protein [Photobacterium swingsii]|uniref:phage tail assembly protein n=1 Tax=Photobacterium swingsii TaxID=680026 RepID=UPI00352E6EA8